MINYSLRNLEPQNRRQTQICEALKHNKEMCFNEIVRKVVGLMGRVQCKREMDDLEKKEIILKTDSGKYQLTKPVRVEQSKHLWLSEIANGKMVNSEIKYFDFEELPPSIQIAFKEQEAWRANLKK